MREVNLRILMSAMVLVGGSFVQPYGALALESQSEYCQTVVQGGKTRAQRCTQSGGAQFPCCCGTSPTCYAPEVEQQGFDASRSASNRSNADLVSRDAMIVVDYPDFPAASNRLHNTTPKLNAL